jgi:bifunctional aspartokinase / homoserine dehydrogenase 1
MPAGCERGIHVLTPNKKALQRRTEYYNELKAADADSAARIFCTKTTVGAGAAGDPDVEAISWRPATRSIRISGILSGTLAYLFNVFDGSVPFSEIVRERGKAATRNRIRVTTFPAWTSRAS